MRLRYFIFLFVCSISLAGCDYIFASRWNYRITVSVDTPEGVQTGSAVRMVRAWRQIMINPDAADVVFEVKGEAVVVDLGKRGTLFALIAWDSYLEVHAALRANLRDHVEEMRYYRKLAPGTKGTLPRDAYPTLVTFTDLNDPESVQIAYGEHRDEDTRRIVSFDKFEALFGDGVRLREITIEITNDPVTWNIDRLLPWLPSYYNKRLDGNRYGTSASHNKAANRFSSGSFSTGK